MGIVVLTADIYEALRRQHLAREDWPGGELFGNWQIPGVSRTRVRRVDSQSYVICERIFLDQPTAHYIRYGYLIRHQQSANGDTPDMLASLASEEI